MFERFRKKKQPEGQAVVPDVKRPNHIVPEGIMKQIRALEGTDQYGEAKKIIAAFLKTLNRPDLMAFKDADQFVDFPEKTLEASWEEYNNAEWERDWPLGKDTYLETIPEIVTSSIPIRYNRKKNKSGIEVDLDLNRLVDQIEGIQKKLDKVETLLSNAEFKLCGKDALKL